MKFTILFGGKAGQGPNILSTLLGQALINRGYYVFMSRDYESVIRGGHNFNVITFSDEQIYSNESKVDLIVALDENTINLHKKKLKRDGSIIQGEGKGNMYFAGRIYKLLCIDFKVLEEQLRELKQRFEENVKEAMEGYNSEIKSACKVEISKRKLFFMNGNKGISDGAVKSGIDVYFAYPMTPATNVISELAERQLENNFVVMELENEIAVINAAIGSAITGAKAMIGTSGGGFDLMTEALSLTGIAETPLVIYLASRPGPSTGIATYTGQGDLDLARHSGHGEFPRLVVAPGDPVEAEELTSQAFFFSQEFGIPAIVLSDKHLAESSYTTNEIAMITLSKKRTELKRYNSYETDEFGNVAENPERIIRNVDERNEKQKKINREAERFENYKIYGNKNSKNVVVSYGSTKGAIVDSIKNLDVKFVQILYLEPFPEKIKKEIEGKNIILVENSATGQLAKLIAEKTGIFIDDKNKILRYDGRPFLHDELSEEIKRRLRR
ncbi:MAG: 2-oxoacid:acceptor oxidoreductase family protein [Candidatus Pacearchaeota archaeon]